MAIIIIRGVKLSRNSIAGQPGNLSLERCVPAAKLLDFIAGTYITFLGQAS